MDKKHKLVLFCFILVQILLPFFIGGCSPSDYISKKEIQCISSGRPALQLGRGGKLSSVPLPDPYSKSINQVDLRSYDLAHLNLKENLSSLLVADFDIKTRWPYSMPESFDPKKIMSLAKEPGLGIKKLHQAGKTGKGVSIAVIGPSLLTGHLEYAESLKYYEEVECTDRTATVDGCLAASVLAGKNCGVAPDADLYYFANTYRYSSSQGETINLEKAARALERLIEVNSSLKENQKIKAVVLYVKWGEKAKGAEILNNAINTARRDGIFVINNFITYRISDGSISINGLGREPLADPDSLDAYRPAWSWELPFYLHERPWASLYSLMLPMDSKAGAAPTGTSDYAFYRYGTDIVPLSYIAGLYAIACQNSPHITPELFLEEAWNTGNKVIFYNNGSAYKLERIPEPSKLINSFEK